MQNNKHTHTEKIEVKYVWNLTLASVPTPTCPQSWDSEERLYWEKTIVFND